MKQPAISIISPCLNRAIYVADAIDSVLQQGYSNLEHIVVDGGSTDGTLDILVTYPHLKLVSEPDSGLYDAINKGLRMAQGEVIGFLNTDDIYAESGFQRVVEAFIRNPGCDAVLGGVSVFIDNPSSGQKTVAVNRPYNQNEFLKQVTQGVPLFNGWFFRRKSLDEIGEFDIRYRYAADRDFLIRMALAGQRFKSIEQVIYYYRHHPDSLTFNSNINAFSGVVQEFKAIAERYLAYKDLAPKSRRTFLTWHSLITSHQAILALRSFKPGLLAGIAAEGFHHNMLWPAIFSREVVYHGTRFALRGLKPAQLYG
jgi:glycosyltransferase involved in cell wall biosynthesis